MTWLGARRVWIRRLARPAAAVVVAALATDSAGANPRSAELRRAGFQLAYNLDYEESLAVFRRAVEADPGDSAAYRAIATVTWLKLLFERGALTADEYLSSMPGSDAPPRPAAADLAALFQRNIDRAILLAEDRLRVNPKDVDGHFNLGAAAGLLAVYTVTVNGSLFSGIGPARRAFSEQEQVLALDPSRKDAAFFTGSYRYAVANLAPFMRWLAYLAGFGGGRERAVHLLEESAAYPSDVQADASIVLVLVYNRENRLDDARRLLTALRGQFPRNRLLWLESSATELRAGRPADSLSLLDAGVAMFERDTRTKAFGEAALWYFRRGSALLALGQHARAEADFRRALSAEGRGWVHGRCRTGLGKLADLSGNRTAAVAEYRQAAALCGGDRDPIGREEAERLLKRAFSGTNPASRRQ